MGTLDKSILDIYFLIAGMYTAVLLAVLIKLLKLSYERQHLNLKLLEDKTSAELEMLKSQINPHFLFNTLNSIYTLSLKKSDQTPEVVLKLSDMLNYLLYECNASKVPLKKEIQLIENYNYLYKIRFGHRLDVQTIINGPVEEWEIAPMLLLPFVENCYKHGVGKDRKSPWIKMGLSVQHSQMTFQLENSKTRIESPKKVTSNGGIGLVNVEKRLNLLYPGKHELKIIDNNETYKVSLKIKIDQ
jgi:LytS/YehU family sensor histidine kinase